MFSWRVNYGNPRKGDVMTIIVEADNAADAKVKAREIARQNGFDGRMGMIRLSEEKDRALMMENYKNEIEQKGRQMADDGFGWQDLAVKLSISEEEAKRFVRQAEFRRMSEAYRARVQPDGETL